MRRPHLRRRRHVRVRTPAAEQWRREEAAQLGRNRAAAAVLDAAEAYWHVMYRPAARVFMAVAMWDAGQALTVAAPDPYGLVLQMRGTEQRAAQARIGLDILASLASPTLPSRAVLPESPYLRGTGPGIDGWRHGDLRARD